MSSRLRPPAILASMIGLCFVAFFWRLGAAGLFDFNEGLYVQAAREMYLRGDWVTASANGIPFFDKPPLVLWLAVLSFRLFGVTEFAARLPVAVAGTGIVMMTWLFARSTFGSRAAVVAAAAAALSPLMLVTSRQMTMDTLQTFWFAAAMFCLFSALNGRPQIRSWSAAGFWTSCAFAFLAKSVPGLFPIAAAAIYALSRNRWHIRPALSDLASLRPALGVTLMAALILPWHVAAYRAWGPYFVQAYWSHHIGLLTAGDFNHSQPFWFNVPLLLAGLFPWSVYLIVALFARGRGSGPGPTESCLFARVWLITVFVLFTLMRSKLISYLLPLYPAAALLVANWIVSADRAAKPLSVRWATVAVGALMGLIGCAGAWYLDGLHPADAELQASLSASMRLWLMHTFLVFGAGGGVVLIVAWLGRPSAGALTTAAILAVAVALGIIEGLPAAQATVLAPLHHAASRLGVHAFAGAPVAVHIGRPRRPSAFFYLPSSMFGQPLTNPPRELAIERWEVEPIEVFLDRTRRPAYVMTDERRGAELMQRRPGLTEDFREGRWLVLKASAP